MSSSRQTFDGGRQEKAAGKSNFVQTCNLLSRYIKQKGSLRDLNFEIGGKVESLEAIVNPGSNHFASASTTMNILTDKGKSAQPSMEQQPSMAPIPSINTLEDASNKPTSKEGTPTDPKTSQLTIFYSGRVLVFDDYPADKAKDLMAYAKKQSSQMSCGILPNTVGEKQSPSSTVASTSGLREGLPPRPQPSTSTSTHKAVGISTNTSKEKINTTGGASQVSSQPEASGSDLPIARRSSLHRFLEKRKDRAATRGPYHQVQEQATSSSKGDEQLELKL